MANNNNNELITEQQMVDLRWLLKRLEETINSPELDAVKNFKCFGPKQKVINEIIAIRCITYDLSDFIEMTEIRK